MVRIKHRYLVVRFLYPATQSQRSKTTNDSTRNLLNLYRPSPQSFDTRSLVRLIKNSVEYMYGDYGLGLVAPSLKVVYFSSATSTAIIRVARAHYRIVWAGLTWITNLDENAAGGEQCVFSVVKVSGTIRKAEEDIISRAKEEIRRVKGQHGAGTQEGLAMLFGPEVKADRGQNVQSHKDMSSDASASDDNESRDESGLG